MRRFFLLCLLAGIFFPLFNYGQVGEQVSSVKVLNVKNDTVNLPLLGKKNLLIFYADPAHPKQNKDFRDYFKSHPINNSTVDSYGVVNLAAAPLIPNSLIRRMAKKEVKGTDAQIYFDPDSALATAWKLVGANNNFAVIFVGKDKVIKFYKAGQLNQEEQDKVLTLIKESK